VINPQVSSFSADWLNVQVIADRFVATSTDAAQYQALRDVVISIFRLLEHTPFWILGMNRDMHFRMKSEDQWHQLGHIVAPKEIWHPLLDHPGLRSLSMQSTASKQNDIQIIRTVRVEPSSQIAPGVYIQLNVEATVPSAAKAGIIRQQQSARELIEYLSESWSAILSEAQTIADHLLSQV
jgi:hypothetical protein